MSKKQNRRVVLTVQPELDSILDNISRLKGQPKSRIIVEILENAKPVLSAISDMLESADNAEKAYYNALKLSHVVNAETGKTDSNFTRTICISEQLMLLDLLTNYTFSSTIDEIKLAEEKYKYSTIAYNWINLSYISNNLSLR